MRPIIVATDFSPVAENAVRYAMGFAQEVKAKVILFHLYKIPSHTANSLVGTKAIDQVISNKMKSFEGYAEALSKTYEVEVETIFKMGDFMEELELEIQQEDISMLVMGMQPKSFEQDLLGSTTTAAIYKLNFPIIAVPQHAQYKGIKHILYAYDFKKEDNDSVLERVKSYAQLLKSKVEVFYVGDVARKPIDKTKLSEALLDVDHEIKDVVAESVIDAIKEEAIQSQADVIIMTPRKYGFWSSLIHKSKTRAMAAGGDIPLLSIPS